METINFKVDVEKAGIRIDRYLADVCLDFSRSYLQKLLKDQMVSVNGKVVKANYKTRAGDEVALQVPDMQPLDIKPEEIPLDILYEDEWLMVVNKPKDMVVHPSAGHMEGTLVNAVMAHCGEHLSGINGVLRPGIVHRIDKDTTGALLICKEDGAHRDLAEQLKEHSIKRRYRAVVQGNIKEDEGTVDAPVGRHPIDRKKMAINHKNGKEAVTHYKLPGTFRQCDVYRVPPGNGTYAPDPCAYGKPWLSASRRYGVWIIQKSISSPGTGTSCNDPGIPSSGDGGISGIYGTASGVFRETSR